MSAMHVLRERCKTIVTVSTMPKKKLPIDTNLLAVRAASSDALAGVAVLALLSET